MEWFSYQHLYYFWVVATEGSIVAACKRLHLSQPTVSAQIRALERTLGETLFDRVGKRLVLTEEGKLAAHYAEGIFSLGREFVETLKGRSAGRRPHLRIGVVDVLPKRIVRAILEPVFREFADIRLICREDKADVLFLELAAQKLDALLTDTPLAPGSPVRAFNHLLAETGTSFFAPAALARRIRKGFPASLQGMPMLLPMENAGLRRSLDQWLDGHGIRPKIIGEFQDSELLDAFGMAGHGVFLGPTLAEAEVRRRSGAVIVGRAPEVRSPIYLISPEKRVRHAAVAHMLEAARSHWGDPR
jgi:LysR family transcriptional activator of nhaA